MSKPAIPQLARGIGTSDLWVVLLVVIGVDVDTATAIFGNMPDAEQIKALLAMLHGEGWQVLLIKGALAGAYLWVRDRNKKAGIEFEIEKLRADVGKFKPKHDGPEFDLTELIKDDKP